MIPDYQTLMLPLLKSVSDGKTHNIQELIDHLSKEFKLTEEDLNEWLPSKNQKTFYNRVYWAKAHLKMAGTIEDVSRGNFKITSKGTLVLNKKPDIVNVKYLMNLFPDYDEKIKG